MRLTNGTGDLDEIGLQNAEYSDDDEEIYFTSKELIEYLFNLEDYNLFNITLTQDDEKEKEELEAASNARLNAMKTQL